jgi:hypothetical protein
MLFDAHWAAVSGYSAVCYNPIVSNNAGAPLINERFFTSNIPRIVFEVGKTLRINDICNGWDLKSLDEILVTTNIPLSLVSYMRLAEAWGPVKRKWGKKINGTGTSTSLGTFFGRFKKGSKNFRKFLTANLSDVHILSLTVVKTFQRISNVVVNDAETFRTLHSIWDNKGLNNQMREFSFKFFNNILGLNTRVSHYYNNRDRKCELCKRDKVNNPEDETFLHLFSRCKVAKTFKKGLVDRCFLNGET